MYLARRFHKLAEDKATEELEALANEEDSDIKVVKYYIKALLTGILIEDVSRDPKEKIVWVQKAE